MNALNKLWNKLNANNTALVSAVVLIATGIFLIIDKWFINAFMYDYEIIFGSKALAVDNIINHDWGGAVFLIIGLITLIKNK
ncbi:MAG: hypothetical protein PHW96_00290 [Candidatus Nanoarchaeia archaeon]|nr:hypothetical protein [Candidatus Nanoarchaeia archaeon]